MNISDAINTIESVAGMTDESTPVGEAWAAILRHIRFTPVAQSVPVSERLPEPEDMTDDGEVWIEDPGHEYPLADAGDYDWEPHKWILRPIGKFDAQNGLRWLPAHALPLPFKKND